MGNEASLEGGEGALAGLPAGLAPDGKGGFKMPAGVEADLTNLSEEERKQLVAAMAKAQSRPPETQAGGTRVPAGLSKSRTVDAFGEGPPPKPKPGRSPSSLSLLESRFRQEPKDPEQPRAGMFSSGFLSGANPLSAVSSAVSSASIPKFSLFGDDEEEVPAKQEGKPPGPQSGAGKGPPQQGSKPPQQGPPKGQGPEGKPGGPGPQQQGPKPGGPGPQQGPKPGGPASQQQGPKTGGPGPQQGPKPGGPGPQQQGPKPGGPGPQQGPKPGGPGPQQQGPKPGGPGPQQGPKPGGPGPQQQGPKPGGPGPQQGPKPGGPGPQQGPKPGGPGAQQQGPKPGEPGPQQQGPKPGGPGPQQQGPGKPGPGVAAKPSGPQQQGKPGPVAQGKAMCPLCNSTELNLQAKDQPPNYNTCTQCKQQVCNLCGFSPPDSAGKEWLCLNCQMQRAVGGMDPPGPPMMKQPPKQGSAPPSPQRKESPSGSPSKGEPGKKPPMLTKQQSIADTGKGSTPPTTPKSGPQQGPQPGQLGAKCGQPPPLQKPSQSPKGSPQPSPAKTTPKQDGGGFFGGFGLGGLTEVTKPSVGAQASESVAGKLFGGFGGSSKPQAGSTAQASESVTGKLFSGFSGLTESAKPTPASSQSAESVSGKMFGFGSSILSSATNLISGEESKSPPESPPGSPPDSPVGSEADSPPGSLPDSGSESPPDTPPAYSKDTASPKPTAAEGKTSADMPPPKSTEVEGPLTPVSGSEAQSCCPLCKVKLNMGSGESPNYSTCTECQKTVCNLCGFNPTPHLSEKEWLCLNCQTQRALSGQLGDMPPPPSPSKLPAKHEPTPSSSPARSASSTPSSSAPTATATPTKGLTRMPSITQAPADKSEPVSAKVDAKDVKNTDAEQGVTAEPVLKSTQVVPEESKEQATGTLNENTEGVATITEQIVKEDAPPSPHVLKETADVKGVDVEQAETGEQTEDQAAVQNTEKSEPEQCQVKKTEYANTFETEPESSQEAPIIYNVIQTVLVSDMEAISEKEIVPQSTETSEPATEIKMTQSNASSPISKEPHSQTTEKQSEELALPSNVDTVDNMPVKESSIETATTDPDQSSIGDVPERKPEASVQIEAPGIESSEPRDNQPSYDITYQEESAEPENRADRLENGVIAEAILNNELTEEQVTETTELTPQNNVNVCDKEEVIVKMLEMKDPFEKSEVTSKDSSLIANYISVDNNDENSEKSLKEDKIEVEDTSQTQLDELSQSPVTELNFTEEILASGSENVSKYNPKDHCTKELCVEREDKPLEKEQMSTDKVVLEKCMPDQAGGDLEILKNTEQKVTLNTMPDNIKFEFSSESPFSEQEISPDKNIEEKKMGDTYPPALQEAAPKPEKTMSETEKVCEQNTESYAVITENENECKVIKDKLSSVNNHTVSEIVEKKFPVEEEIRQIPDTVTEKALEQSVMPRGFTDQKIGVPSSLVVSKHEDEKAVIEIKPEELQSTQQVQTPAVTSTTSSVKDKLVSEELMEKALVVTDLEVTKKTKLESTANCVPHSLDHDVEVASPPSTFSQQERNKSEEGKLTSEPQEKLDDVLQPLIKSNEINESGENKEEAPVPVKESELLRKPGKKDKESSPMSPSDLAKLESTVLPILEAQTTSKEISQTETPKVKRRLEVLPMSPEPSSEDDQHGESQEQKIDVPKKERKKLLVPTYIQGDSFEDSSEGEPSPKLQRKKTVGDKEVEMESPMDEEDFIRKQIIEMSADEDASPSDEENIARRKIKDQEKTQMEQNAKKDEKDKRELCKGRRLLKNSSISPEDEPEQKSIISITKIEELAKGEQPSVDSGAGIRHFKTIELNSTATVRQISDDGELESLTDSPDDRSRGEGSSSLHASSFTPGTSPTSLSSLDEDSDSSSPSHVRSSGEGKQQRKAKHRSGQLPTIEDSSEEEELREEEELLREQEKQKGTGKKSKKDKEEIRAQRRRERPKTPPSNLSPIEDASPTEELRQEAEMEEFRRSSCSDLSPSMESEPESFEILPEKIVAVQKVYQLPTSVSLYSPTDEQHTDSQSKEKRKHALRSADEAYEEIMLKVKSPTNDGKEHPPGKESLYGSILIENYAYESLVDDASYEQEPDKLFVSEKPKKTLRSPDEVYEDMMQRKEEMMLKEQEIKHSKPVEDAPKAKTVLPETDSSKEQSIMSSSTTGQSGKDRKPLLDAEAAYEELMKKQRAVLTPGTSPTQAGPDLSGMAQVTTITQGEKTEPAPLRRILPIPDLRVTQCSSGEEESGEESISDQTQDSEKATVSVTKTEPEPLVDEAFQKASVSEPVVEDLSLQREVALPAVSSDSQDATENDVGIEQTVVVDLSKSSAPSQIDSFTAPVPSVISRPSAPVVVSVSPLPTVPQYIVPTVPSVVSTAPPVPPKPVVLRRAASLEKADIPVPPPLPPPTLPKPSVYPKKTPPQVPPRTTPVGMPTTGDSVPVRQPLTPGYKPHVPPPVPPKPSSIPAGLTFSHKPGETVKPRIAPKPIARAQPPFTAHTPTRPTILSTSSADSVLNLSPSAENKTTSPLKSPTSPRFGKVLRDTYVVITLPSQPGSPTEGITTQASIGPSQESLQKPPHSPPQPPPQSQTTRVPLAFTRITESIESQEICGPEKVVSSMSHVYKAISASTQPQSIIPNVGIQVVTTEVQRTTVSVLHERTPPPHPIPRASGISVVQENIKPEPAQVQNGHAYHPGEVVDLRTPKIDAETSMKGVDLSSSESRRQSLAIDSGGRQQSAVQSSVVNLSTDTSSVSVVTDNITILTCTATVAYGSDVSLSTSMPLQLTTAKSFEPVSQIIYRPVDSQPEKPINLSTTTGKTVPVTMAPTIASNGICATMPPRLETGLSGAVDLTTVKPAQTVVAMNGSTAEVVTAVITEDDGKPVDLTAGRRAVCCDVVYKLPFASSCTTQQASAPLPEDRFGYRDDHYQYDRTPHGMRGLGGIKPSMSDTNLAEAGLFLYKSKHSYDYKEITEGAVDLTSGKMSVTGEAVDYSNKSTGVCTGMTVPQYTQARITSAVGTHYGASSVLRSSNGIVYSSVAATVPSTYAITTQPGSIFSTSYNTLSGMHTSDTMPSLSTLQNQPLTRSHSFLSTIAVTTAEEQSDLPLNLETVVSKAGLSTTLSDVISTVTTVAALDTYTNASLEAIAASLEALSSPLVPGDGQYQIKRELLELEKMKQQRLAEELEWERQEIQRFRDQEQLLVQKELEELQAMKQQILCQQEEDRQAHLLMQKETYAQQQEQLEQIQRLQEQLRHQLEEQKFRQMYPGEVLPEALVVAGERKMDSGCQTDEEDNTEKAYTAGRKKKSTKKSVDSCVQTDDEDQDEWEVPARSRRSRTRGGKNGMGERGAVSVQALTEISVQTDPSGTLRGHSVQVDTRLDYPDSDRTSSPKRRPTPLDIGQSPHLKADASTLQVVPGPPKSPKVLYSPISPCVSPSKSLEYLSYEKSLGDTSPQRMHSATDLSKGPPTSPRAPKVIQRSMSDPKPMSPTAEERAAANFQYSEGYSGKGSPSGTPSGTQKKVKRTLPNPPSEEEAVNAGQTAYSTGSARRRLCRSTNMARAKILQDIDRELDLVERESSKLRKKQAELDEEEKEIDAKLRYLEMGINRRKEALLKEREKRERAYLQSVAEDRDYMSDSEVSNIRETRVGEEVSGHGLERPRTAPQSELDEFVPPQTKHDQYGKYSQYQYPQYQQSLYQPQSPYQSQSIYSSVPSLTASQQQSYHQMLLLQQKARQQAALLSELDSTKISTNYDTSSYLGGKYGNHLDLHSLEEHAGSLAVSPMSNVSADSFYADLEQHQTPRSYMLLEDATELAKSTVSLSSDSYGIAERELAKAEHLLRHTAADVGTDYLGSSSRLHSYGKAQDEEDPMEEPFELKLLKQQLKQEFQRSTGGTESLEQLAGLSHHYTTSTGVSSGGYRAFPKTEKYSISRLTLEKQAAKQLPTSMLYQKHKNTSNIGKYSSIQDSRALETDYSSYLGSSSASPRSSRLLQDEITFGLRKNIAEQQKYLGSTLGANLAGSLNLGQSLNLSPGMRSTLGEDSAYPSGSRSRPSSRPSSVYGLDLSLKRDTSSSSLRLKAEGDPSSDTSAFQAPSGRSKPTSLPIVQGGRGRIPIVAQNSEEESPLSPVGQPMGMARASAGPLPPISADSRDQFGSCLSLQDPQQQHLREDPSRGRGYVLMDDLQGTMSDSEALSESLVGLSRDDPGNSHENVTNAYHLRREETDWFDKPRDGCTENGQGDRRQGKSAHYPFPHARIKLQRDPKDHSVSGNGLGIRVVGGKEVPGSNGHIGAYVAKVLPGGAAEQTRKIVEGMQVLEWNSISLTGKTYEEVQGLVGHQVGEAEICVRLDLNMLSDSESSHLDLQDQTKGDRPPRSPGVDPKQLAAELQKVSQQQMPSSSASTLDKASASAGSSAVPSPGQPGSPSVSKKRHSKTSEAAKTQSHSVSGEIQLQINYDKQLGNLIVHVLQARNLAPRDNNGYSDPFVKVYLLPGRGQVMVVQNASAENKRRSKHVQKSLNPEWNQTVIYKNIHLEQLRKKTLEVSVWDYDKSSANDFLGEYMAPAQIGHLDPRHHRHSVVGVLTIQRAPSESPANEIPDGRHLTLRKAMSEERPQPDGASRSHRSGDAPVTAASLDSGLSGSAYSLLDEEGGTNAVDSAIFQVPRFGKIPNGTEAVKSAHGDTEGKTQVIGEIKIALKKEMKTEGEHLVLEILQCRNITYKFKSPDHLPDLYVKLYVVNVATQKRIIKKKTRVCRHDREPSFNETFRFCMNPTGHSIQLFLVSNGGKFLKKTLIGEAYVWLDKVDLRKRVVSWHKLLASTAQIHS
ncbi:protein piccolo-like [Sinocyclocheilus anshuiensis]|uniref:protein piccolo-like n=1 Tax=Sinocyclocheilus anshuiensis TaxID=1608454 RepID=UPI0007B8A448|nr:PREDICTED: protein piccolo-like [Sinocyclocheilus anshuiensis]